MSRDRFDAYRDEAEASARIAAELGDRDAALVWMAAAEAAAILGDEVTS